MCFLADMGVSMGVVEWLRGGGHDAVHLREQRLQEIAQKVPQQSLQRDTCLSLLVRVNLRPEALRGCSRVGV